MNMDDKIRQAFENATPDVLESVLSDCGKQKGVSAMNENKKSSRIAKIVSTAAIVVLLVAIGTVAVSVIGSGFTLNPSAQPGDSSTLSAGSEDTPLDPDAALAVALNHAGLREALVNDTRIEIDEDDDGAHYDISFCDGQYDYEYEIDYRTGKILEHEKEPCSNGPTGNTVGPMTGNEAIEYALRYAGLGMDDVTDLSCEREDDRDIWCYEVEFDAGGYEYHYLIDAVTGKLLQIEKEPSDDNSDLQVGGGEYVEPLTEEAERAVEVALAEVTWTREEVTNLSCELDDDDGEVPHYDIEFEAGNVEYDIEVHAQTYVILNVEKEIINETDD